VSNTEEKSIAQRNTRQKAAIRDVFESVGRPLGPFEVLEFAKPKIKGIGIATIYRNIKALLEEGWLTTVELPGEPSRYEVSGKEHHHHFSCRNCKRIFEIPGCPIPVKPKMPPGFVTESHEIVLYGFCPQCPPPAVTSH
jgi:Fur family transcriptional regulator, ferric uptake regulator